ncbi:hypothetical protein [Clostridium sp. ATCC 25772]|uniref:hypothetical protein n=1 Tax=Clostridium sp. ATCC 25772 TaxID=1676991 RepID=UPI000782DF27|nr:hypothetical protein [Clostridium sp. ATCC 25772]
MKDESIFTKWSLGILVLSFLVLVNEFVQFIPTHATVLEGILILIGPSIFAFIGGVFSIIGIIRHKTKLAVFLIIINAILLFWWVIYWIIGTLVLGV